MAEKGRDIGTHAGQLSGKRAIFVASLSRVGTRDNEDPGCPTSSKPSGYVPVCEAVISLEVGPSTDPHG